MTTELKDGQTLELGSVESGQAFTYRGKPVKFELVDEQSNQYQAKVTFTEEEKQAGNQDVVLTYIGPQKIEGTVNINGALPQEDNLTDAEKFTLRNSIQYQTGVPETTQIANGVLRTSIGVKALENRKEEGLTLAKTQAVQKAQEEQQKANETIANNNTGNGGGGGGTQSPQPAPPVEVIPNASEQTKENLKTQEQTKAQTPTKIENKK